MRPLRRGDDAGERQVGFVGRAAPGLQEAHDLLEAVVAAERAVARQPELLAIVDVRVESEQLEDPRRLGGRRDERGERAEPRRIADRDDHGAARRRVEDEILQLLVERRRIHEEQHGVGMLEIVEELDMPAGADEHRSGERQQVGDLRLAQIHERLGEQQIWAVEPGDKAGVVVVRQDGGGVRDHEAKARIGHVDDRGGDHAVEAPRHRRHFRRRQPLHRELASGKTLQKDEVGGGQELAIELQLVATARRDRHKAEF